LALLTSKSRLGNRLQKNSINHITFRVSTGRFTAREFGSFPTQLETRERKKKDAKQKLSEGCTYI
jgi:hypothetical protein